MPASFVPDVVPRLPSAAAIADLGIALVGCGGIVEHGHMPAYRAAGLRVVGVASRDAARAKAFGDRWAIPAFTHWRELVERPEVRIVDLSYPFDEERMEVIRAACAAGKHLMIQKPMAHSLATAREIVRLAQDAGVVAAVNQNGRWCPQYRAARQAVAEGLIGDVHLAVHEMRNHQDRQDWFNAGWYGRAERFQLMEYSVHHLDLLRWWMDDQPIAVQATIARKTGQRSRGEVIAAAILRLPRGRMAVMIDDNAAPADEVPLSRFRLDGSRGSIEGSVYARNELTIRSELLGPGPHRPTLTGSWFPDGFAGTMGELMRAIVEGHEPSISARDNVRTLELVFAAYDSAGA